MNKEKEYKVGLIGIGIWGKKVLKSLIGLGVEVIVCDINVDNFPPFQFSDVQYYDSFNKFLKIDVDGYIIASSTSSHMEILLSIKERNKPIFVEKPLCNKIEDIFELENQKFENTFMMHIWKYHEGVRMLSKLRLDRSLGKFLGVKSMRLNWTSPRKDTNSLWNLGIHDLTICESILGHIPNEKKVLAEKHHKVIRSATVLMGSQPYYYFEVSNRYPKKQREIRLFFTNAVAILKNELIDYISIYRGDDKSPMDSLKEEKVYFDNKPPLDAELKEFINFLGGGKVPQSPISEGIRLAKHIAQIEDLCNE